MNYKILLNPGIQFDLPINLGSVWKCFTLVAKLMAVGGSLNQIHMIFVVELLLSRSVEFECSLKRQAC